jgi:predicted DNA-binding transcriptional regulator AlpA
MRKRRHRLNLEDFQNLINHCEGCDCSILDGLLRNCDMARLLQVSHQTIYFWVNKKDPDIPHVRIGGKRGVVRFPKQWIVEWAKKREEAIRRQNFEL